MAPAALKIDARRRQILELLERDGRVTVAQLSERFGATPVTIRSDLDALERAGSLERVSGGAISKMRTAVLAPRAAHLEEKRAIARETASLIRDGDTLFINSGTTNREVAAALKNHRNLNVVTNSVMVATELSGIPTFRVILLGGELDAQYLYTCGGDAQEQLQKYQADYAILSIDGVSAENGITTHHAAEAIIDRMMVEQAKKVLIVSDHTKMGRAGFSHICPIGRVHTVITDSGCTGETAQQVRAAQTNVVIAQTSGTAQTP